MASPLQSAGASVDPTRSAALTMNRYITGLWTQRSPMRDAATPYLYEKFYQATRFDSLLDGLNIENTIRLTLGRSPGSSVYNSQLFPAVRRFFPFKTLVDGTEVIRVMADTDTNLYDATGPNTKLNIWSKSTGSGQTYYQQVGNTLYFSNGIDAKKWIVSSFTWQAGKTYSANDFVIDSNYNVQMAVGSFVVAVTGIAIANNVLTVTLDANDDNLPYNLNFMQGVSFTFAGLTVATFLNGQTVHLAATTPIGGGASIFTAAFAHADYSNTADTGSVTSGSGATGIAAPAWNAALLGVTVDGGAQWINRGSWVQNWGIIAPPKAPTVTQQPLPQTVPGWAKGTYYSTSFLIYDAANHIQKVKTFGTTGSAEPAPWNDTGGTTLDNTVVWQDQGLGTYASSAAVTYGKYIMAADASGTLYFYQAASSGTTGAVPPVFTSALGSKVTDNNVLWVNVGIAQKWSSITSSSLTGNFGTIPVLGGGSVCIGVGQTAANGTVIALPAGYTLGNSLAWSTAGNGYNSGTEISGVYQSSSAGGLLTSNFQNRSNGIAFAASSNWAIAAWTAGAAVTLTEVGGFQYAQFTTALGDPLCICVGSASTGLVPVANAVPVPTGFLASQFANIAGPAGTANTGNGMNVLQGCTLDAAMNLSVIYNDDSGNRWGGTANIFGIFYQAGGGVVSYAVTNGTAITIPTAGTQVLALVYGTCASGASFGLPPAFTQSSVAATSAMASGILFGSNVSHGWNCSVTGQKYTGNYSDGVGIYTTGSGHIFALAAILNTTPISPSQEVVDSNGSLQSIAVSGVSGTTQPLWRTTRGSLTTDSAATWQNGGSYANASTGAWTWGYGYRNLVDGSVSTTSAQSAAITLNAGYQVLIQGQYSTDPQTGSIVIYRTVQDGSALIYDDEIPNNPNGGTWSYVDTNSDQLLNALILAPIAHHNDPPLATFQPSAYHLGRIWGFVGNVLTYSGGPDTTYGNGNTAFPPLNAVPLTSSGTRVWSTTIGLISLTNADAWITLGLGTSASSFSTVVFQEGIGLGDFNQFTVQGSTAYMKTTSRRVISWDPGAGELEVGLPIGDQFETKFPKTGCYLTFHDGSSEDVALYAADGTTGWFRMSALAAPESGSVWSTFRSIVGGTSAVRSIEVQPGDRRLLIGPSGANKSVGPILQRDYTTYSDNGVPYQAYGVLGSIVVADPGSAATIEFVTLRASLVGSAPSVALLLGEFSGLPTSPPWINLLKTANDQPLQAAPKTLYSQRYHMAQVQQNQSCNHLQLKVSWPAEDAANELLTHTIYGSLKAE